MKNIEKLAKTLADFFYPLVEISLLSKKGEEIAVFNRFEKIQSPIGSGIEVLSDGRRVKVAKIELEECDFCVKYDVSLPFQMQGQLTALLGDKCEEMSWQKQIDAFIQHYFKEKGMTHESASRKEKRDLIFLLKEKGLFDYKDASHYIAHVLGLSRATVYNYLNWKVKVSRVKVHQVDTFTKKRFSGNPAGVVLDADSLEEEMMRQITREMNLSETAFVLSSSQADFRLRYFTPTGHEVVFCGHSTVGSLFMLAHEKRYGMRSRGTYPFTVETLSGCIAVKIKLDRQDKITVQYETPKIDLCSFDFSPADLAHILGISEELFDCEKPLMIEKTNRHIILAVKSLAALEKMQFDFNRLEAFSREHKLVAFAFLTHETFDARNDLHMRCYAPAVGIPEDPFTGSVLGGVLHYAEVHRLVRENKKTIGVEQGHFIKRPGSVKVSKHTDNSALVTADAVHLFSTEIKVN